METAALSSKAKWGRGRRPLGPAVYRIAAVPSPTERIARDSLNYFLPPTGPPLPVRLGSVEEGYDPSWLTASQRSFLEAAATGPKAYLLTIAPEGITVVGKGRWGMLYGVQTVNQLGREALRQKRDFLPCLTIHCPATAPPRPSIAAFTLHRQGAFGVAGADHEVLFGGSK